MEPAAYSDRDLKEAADFREAMHREALKRVRAVDPAVVRVIDPHPAEDYLLFRWEYPGAWYVYVGVPEEFESRDALIRKLVKDTLAARRADAGK